MVTHETTEHTPNHMIGHLSLPVELRVICTAEIELGIKFLPNGAPKMTNKLHISIKSDRTWDAKEMHNVLEE
ncbi:hypothetical protein Syun_020500 [Stephania yunnanensis]|uniref:Uncharacterized protein n=1 Tax=Stephania yunnanensis TaxID=152371 RepID=A0AAP0IEQ5_9MAGN